MLDQLKQALRAHWPEYLIEGWALGTFMIAAGVVGTLLEYPGSALNALLLDAFERRVLAGVAMGLTAIALIYSPWGKRSGAHMNPAVTLTFLSLGKVRRVDALFFVLAQFAGGLLGVLAVRTVLGSAFTDPPVSWVTTLPGPDGVYVAFVAEVAISCLLMLAVLTISASKRAAPLTGVVAGCLVATYIALEGPLSGMSMNPARSLASALPGLMLEHLWIYFTAPVVGMLAGAQIHLLLRGSPACAKLLHPLSVRCIHCGYEPANRGRSAVSSVSRSAQA
jgi:aquaporin Z